VCIHKYLSDAVPIQSGLKQKDALYPSCCPDMFLIASSCNVEKDFTLKLNVCSTNTGIPRLKCDGTRAETRLRLSAKGTSPFKSAGGVSSVDYWQPRCAHQR
jgi:hypothetical protein